MGTIHKAFKIRIYPTQDQQVQINKTLGCCRFLYNQMLNEREWTCPNCGKFLNRDSNAGINLRNYGLEKIRMNIPEFKPVEKVMHKVTSKKQEIYIGLENV